MTDDRNDLRQGTLRPGYPKGTHRWSPGYGFNCVTPRSIAETEILRMCIGFNFILSFVTGRWPVELC